MNKVLFLICFLVLAVGCHREYDLRRLVLREPLISLSLLIDESNLDPEHLSGKEIIKQSYAMSWRNDEIDKDHFWKITEVEKDTVDLQIVYWTNYLTSFYNATILSHFIHSYDFVVVRNLGDAENVILDTIAYIPNSIVEEAARLYQIAIDQEDSSVLYQLFNDFYVLKPVTGEQWRNLEED